MLKFQLDDLTVEGLRKLADLMGISKTVTAREQLLSELNNRMASDVEVILGKSATPWYRTPAIMVSVVAAVIAFSAMGASWYSVHITVSRDVEQKQKERVHRWQEVIVYKIIEEGTKTDQRTISFDEIRHRYVNEAAAADVVELKKEELQPWTLRKVLQDLIALQLVYQALDDKYCIQRSAINPRADRIFLEDQAKYAIRIPSRLTV